MRELNVEEFYGNDEKLPRIISFIDTNKRDYYEVEYKKEYNGTTSKVRKNGEFLAEFEGSLRYIGEGIFILVKTISFSIDINNKVNLNDTSGKRCSSYSLIIFKEGKVKKDIEPYSVFLLTEPNIIFLNENDHNKIIFKIEKKKIIIKSFNFIDMIVKVSSSEDIKETRYSYIGEIGINTKQRGSAQKFFGYRIEERNLFYN